MKIVAQGGFVKLIVLIVIILLVLGYFGFDLSKVIKSSPESSDNLQYIASVITNTWNVFIVRPALFVWNKFLDLIWKPLLNFRDKANRTSVPQEQIDQLSSSG